jgi:hypothetical protein
VYCWYLLIFILFIFLTFCLQVIFNQCKHGQFFFHYKEMSVFLSKKAFYFEIIENKVKQRKIYIQYIQNDWTDGLYLNSQTCIQRTVTMFLKMYYLFIWKIQMDLHTSMCIRQDMIKIILLGLIFIFFSHVFYHFFVFETALYV